MDSTARGRGFAWYAWAVLGFNLAVILCEAVVRATGSVETCGAPWPLCQGLVIPHFNRITAVIEFAHRASSGIDLVLVGGLVYLAFRQFARGDSVRRYATAAAFFTLTETLTGAALVLYGEVGKKISLSSVGILSLHLANTFLLLAALALTAWGTWEPASQPTARKLVETRAGKPFRLRLAFGTGVVATFIVAIFGTIELFRAGSLVHAMHWDFAAPISPIMIVRIIYPLIAFVSGIYLLVLGAYEFLTGTPAARRLAEWLLGLVVLHLWTSVFSVLVISPIWRQVVNLFATDLIWVALVVLAAEALGWRRAVPPVPPQLELAAATGTPHP